MMSFVNSSKKGMRKDESGVIRKILGKEKPLVPGLLLMLMSKTIIVYYMFFIVPSHADVDLFRFFSNIFTDYTPIIPENIYYLLPILLLLGVVIIVLGNSRISIWLIGIVILFIEMFNCLNDRIWARPFALDTDMFSIASLVMPFWCIFFFLWELLFCGIAKWWRRKLDAKDSGME